MRRLSQAVWRTPIARSGRAHVRLLAAAAILILLAFAIFLLMSIRGQRAGIRTQSILAPGAINVTYNISDLAIEIPNFTNAPDLGIPKPKPKTAIRPTPPSTKTRDERLQELADLVMHDVDPASWLAHGGTGGSIQINRMPAELVIAQSKRNHDAIRLLLDRMHAARAVQVTVEVRFLIADALFQQLGEMFPGAQWQPSDDDVEGWPDYLSAGEADSLIRTAQAANGSWLVTAPRLTLANGQRAYVLVSRQSAYIADFTKATAKNGAVAFTPTIDLVQSGMLLDCEAQASSDRSAATLTLRPQMVNLVDITPQRWPKSPPGWEELTVQSPLVNVVKFATTVEIPDGKTAVLRAHLKADPPSTTRPAGLPVMVLVRPRIFIQKPDDQNPTPRLERNSTTRPATTHFAATRPTAA